MTLIHQLQPATKSKNKKRIGRGGKRGTYSGRGIKGQKSRAGRRIKPAFKQMIQRLPKLKGFRNKPLKPKPAVVNLGDLEKKIKENIINRKSLIEAGIIKESDKRIKILGQGEIQRSFQVEGLKISKKAREKIEKAGGSVK